MPYHVLPILDARKGVNVRIGIYPSSFSGLRLFSFCFLLGGCPTTPPLYQRSFSHRLNANRLMRGVGAVCFLARKKESF